jgi:hypothetical protein
MSDTPMHRRLFVEMTPAEQEQFLSALQERRLRVVHQYEDMQKLRKAARDERTAKLVDQQSSMMEKEITALSKVEARAAKIAALRAMIEAEAVDDGQDSE